MAAAKPSAGRLDRAIGENVMRIREDLGASHDDLAQALRDRGWRASGSTIVGIEHGYRAVRLSEALQLADALHVPVADLLRTEMTVRIGSMGPIDGEDLLARLTKGPRDGRRRENWAQLTDDRGKPRSTSGSRAHRPVEEAMREAERHAADRLGLAPDEVVRRSYARWNHTLTEERDLRAADRLAPDATKRQRAAVRAHVTRQLLRELTQGEESKR